MQNDFAVVIGLQDYPGIDDPNNDKPPLTGPVNDAKNFKDWLMSPDGGDVPEQNIAYIVSSSAQKVPKDEFWKAVPNTSEIVQAFIKLQQNSLNNQSPAVGLGSRVGRRLYIYMSGHGIAPSTFGNKLEKEAALLPCDVGPTNISAVPYHIPGGYVANWFCENDCFEEVFLFMDCCRDPQIVNGINMFFNAKGNKDDTTRFYAFSTGWSRKSRERDFNGTVQGVFTSLLLKGLKGASADPDPQNPDNGVITVRSLKNFLYTNLNRKIDSSFQEPDISYYPPTQEGADIIIKASVLEKFPVIVIIPVNATGNIDISDRNFNTIAAAAIVTPPQELHFSLPKGKYLLTGTVNNLSKKVSFDVTGSETPGNERRVSLQ